MKDQKQKVEVGVYSIGKAIYLYFDQMPYDDLMHYLLDKTENFHFVANEDFNRICIIGTDFLYTLIDYFFNGETVYKREENPFFPEEFEIQNLNDDKLYFYDGLRQRCL